MSGAARPPATIQVARRVLRHEIHVTRKFHTSAVWPGVECGRSKMATSEMSRSTGGEKAVSITPKHNSRPPFPRNNPFCLSACLSRRAERAAASR